MLKNYLKLSVRNILRHKLFSFINITGLVMSLTICLAAITLIYSQFQFDTFHPNEDRIYRVITSVASEDRPEVQYATSPLPLAETLRREYDGVEHVVRMYRELNGQATANNRSLFVRGAFTDPTFFDVFGFELASGDPETALDGPFSVVLTRATAERFFGQDDPMGQTFGLPEVGDFIVTGVLDASAYKTHIQFDLLASFEGVTSARNSERFAEATTDWADLDRNVTYVQLESGAGKEAFDAVLSTLSDRVFDMYGLQETYREFRLELQPLSDISPGKSLRGDTGRRLSLPPDVLWTIGLIGFVILAMACFNYTNLTIARSVKRAKEIGVYKVFGAERRQIMMQFVVQATLMAAISLVLAYLVLPLVPLSVFEEPVASTPLDPGLIASFVLFVLATGLFAGAVPAWVLSSLSPIQSLRGMSDVKLIKGFTLRKMLVVAQFTIAIVMTITTLITYKQTRFASTTDYGFRQEGLVHVRLQDQDPALLKEEFMRLADVERVSAMSVHLGVYAGASVSVQREESATPISAAYFSADRDAVPNLELELVAGTNFSEGVTAERETQILINERFAGLLGFASPVEAVGQMLLMADSLEVQVMGVLEDIHYESLNVQKRPVVFRYKPDEFRYLNVRVASPDRVAVAGRLHAAWQKVAPGVPFNYTFTDEYLYAAHGHREDILAVGYYTFFLLVIASLGLLGMVTYTVEVRTREVGIRKVLGAGIPGVIALLSREFVVLIVIAAVLGLPTGYLMGHQIVSTYAYGIDIGLGVLLVGVVIMLVVGLTAIGLQTWKIARENPVNALRAE